MFEIFAAKILQTCIVFRIIFVYFSKYRRLRRAGVGNYYTFLHGPATDNERSYWAGGSKLDVET